METFKKLSAAIGINSQQLNNIINYSDTFYTSYYKKKKRKSKFREISAPSDQLKTIQRWVLDKFLVDFEIHSRANGFVTGRNIKKNATYHLNKKYILCIDILNFFPSIKQDRIFKVFFEKTKDSELSYKLAKLLCYKKRLPQGAPTSPILSNIIFKNIDEDILQHCSKNLITYSRYADDLTFSCDNRQALIDTLSEVRQILYKEKFHINMEKTRIYSGKNRMIVTGLILNSGTITIGRNIKKNLRAEIYQLIIHKDSAINKNKVAGYLSFLKDIEPKAFEKFRLYIDYLKKNRGKILKQVALRKKVKKK